MKSITLISSAASVISCIFSDPSVFGCFALHLTVKCIQHSFILASLPQPRRGKLLGRGTVAMRKYRFYDFFAGAGLVRLGLGSSWTSVWANDIDPKKAEIYIRNFGDRDFHLGDVNDVDPNSLPTPVEMAWASFPCQDLSLAGWRRGMSAERSGTFWAFWRIMRQM